MIVGLNNSELVILKQVKQGKHFANEIKLKKSRAMKYRIIKKLIAKNLLQYEIIEDNHIKRKLIYNRNKLHLYFAKQIHKEGF